MGKPISRRTFLITVAVTGTGLLIANREELLKSQDDLSIDKIIAKLTQLKEGAVQSMGT